MLEHARLRDLPDIVWTPSASDVDQSRELVGLPDELARLLEPMDGVIAFGGALHIRGSRSRLPWHDIFEFWRGDHALASAYPRVLPDDVPFAANCLGDQFLLRRGVVLLLIAETGELEAVDASLDEFLDRCALRDPNVWLGAKYLRQFRGEGGDLGPEQVLVPLPPLVMAESEKGVRLGPVSALEALGFYADFARTIDGHPDGTWVKIVVKK